MSDAFNLHHARWRTASKVATQVGLIVALAYVSSSSLSAWLGATMLEPLLKGRTKGAHRDSSGDTLNLTVKDNYSEIRRSIMRRNLFNSGGEFPDEKSPSRSEEKAVSNFDMGAPCSKPTINVELVGTIYMGAGGGSIATVMEQGYGEADIYKEGDVIIGNEQVSVVQIERNRVVLNNKGMKECLELTTAGGSKRPGDGFPSPGGFPATSGGAPSEGQPSGHDCSFDEKYVQDELGPGFGTIIQKARLVPNTTDSVMNGFKIFAIDSASLLGKSGLQNGDIITQVNDTSLKQPEQGFALYQALQDEKEVRIHILRKGTIPMTITCRIK